MLWVLAGMVGFEPTIYCTKNSCPTARPHPNSEVVIRARQPRVQAPIEQKCVWVLYERNPTETLMVRERRGWHRSDIVSSRGAISRSAKGPKGFAAIGLGGLFRQRNGMKRALETGKTVRKSLRLIPTFSGYSGRNVKQCKQET